MADSKNEIRIFGILIVICAIFFAWLIFKPEKPKQDQPTIIKMVDLSEFRSLPLANFGNLSFINLKINNNEGYFLIDTGAEESVFNITYVDSLHVVISDSIPIPNTQIFLTDSVYVTAHDSLFHFQKRFYTYNLQGLQSKIVETDSTFYKAKFLGILGQDLMKQEGMILNFQNNKIYLTNKYNKID